MVLIFDLDWTCIDFEKERTHNIIVLSINAWLESKSLDGDFMNYVQNCATLQLQVYCFSCVTVLLWGYVYYIWLWFREI